MKRIEEKALHFVAALSDVYKDEENRELGMLPPIDSKSIDVTEDFTAMLIAMKMFFDRAVFSNDDLLDFTYLLNKLAVQYIMEDEEKI